MNEGERKQRMKKTIYLGTNTKMYKNIAQTVCFLRELEQSIQDIDRRNLTLFVIPSYTALQAARASVGSESILIGAQNMCWETEGPFTGEVSPLMLKEVGTDIVEIGHGERRRIFGETDEQEMRKVKCALEHDFTALLCIGETDSEKQSGRADAVLRQQLEIGLSQVGTMKTGKLWIAYEPVWAIGTGGKPVPPDYVQERHHTIRACLQAQFGQAGTAIPILYGGGVNHENASALITLEGVDGLFIGRAAWQAKRFADLIRQVLEAVENR